MGRELGRKESYPVYEWLLPSAEGARTPRLPPSFLPAPVSQGIYREVLAVLSACVDAHCPDAAGGEKVGVQCLLGTLVCLHLFP